MFLINIKKTKLYPDLKHNSPNDELIKFNIALLSEAYHLKIRDIDQLIDKLHSCLRSAEASCSTSEKTQYINVVALVVGLIEQDMNSASFHERRHLNNIKSSVKNSTIDIAKDFDITTYIDLCMSSVVLVNEIGRDSFGRPTIEQSLPFRPYYRELRGEDPSIEFLNLTDSLSNINEAYNSERAGVRIWLWPDIKKTIELAGNIE